jgi:poly(A) polymerase
MIKKFKLSNIDKRLLSRNINWLIGKEKISKASVIKLWLDFGERDVKDLKDILLIKNNSIKKDLVFYLNNPPPNFPVSGKDLLNIGLKEGKELGDTLSKIRDWWIYKNCKPSHSECLDKVKSL